MHVKEIIRKLSWIMIAIFPFCDFAMGETKAFQVVPQERIPEILNTISKNVHQNFLQISSWEGEVRVSRYVVYKGKKAKDVFENHTYALGEQPNAVAKFTESTTAFSSDLGKGLLYARVSRKTPSRYMDLASGRDLGTKSIPWYRVSILTPQYHLHSSPSRMREGYPVQRKAVKEKVSQDSPSCEQPSTFDPRDLFDARSPVWLQYPRIVEHIREKGEYVVDGYTLRIEEQSLPEGVQYRVHEPAKIGLQGGNIWLIKTFSSDAGYNMISSEMTGPDGESMHKRTLEYQSLQGIYVPSKAKEENFDPEDGSLQYQKTRTFKNVRLNHAIPAEVFTYKNLGLENGDKFIDKILGKEYIYQDRELIPIRRKK